MKKEVFIAFGLIILIAGTFAQTMPGSTEQITQEVSNYIKSFVNEEGINKSQITDISVVDVNNLPKELEIKQIETNNIGIYEVNYTENNIPKKVFLVTYSTNELKERNTIAKNVQSFIFGKSIESSSSDYLEVAGVKTSDQIGYVMIHSGSITALSTSLEITGGTGKLFIEVYKNGKDTGFGNVITSSDNKKLDYDTQSENIVTYEPGDIIAVYVYNTGDVTWKNTIATVETTN